MSYSFRILNKTEINSIIPLIQKLSGNKNSNELLFERFSEMFTQNYECAGVFDDENLIGVTGMWFCTRHYSGRSMEIDHVFIDEAHRGKGLGKNFLNWVSDYGRSKGYESCELNTYVSNSPSHKFYFNEGFSIYAYHFFKKL